MLVLFIGDAVDGLGSLLKWLGHVTELDLVNEHGSELIDMQPWSSSEEEM